MTWNLLLATLAVTAAISATASAQDSTRGLGRPVRIEGPAHWPDEVVCHFNGAVDTATGLASGRGGQTTVILRLALAPGSDGRWLYLGYGGAELRFTSNGMPSLAPNQRAAAADCYQRSIQQLLAAGLAR